MNYAAVRHLGPDAQQATSAAPLTVGRMPWELDDEHSHARQETWLLSFIDILALLLTLFVLLLAFQHRDTPKDTISAPTTAARLSLPDLAASADPDPLSMVRGEGYAMPGNGLVPLAAADAAQREDMAHAARSATPAAKPRADVKPQADVKEQADVNVRADAGAQAAREPRAEKENAIPTATPADADTAAASDAAAPPPQTAQVPAPAEAASPTRAEASVQAQPHTPAVAHTAAALQQRLNDSELAGRVEVNARPGAVDLVISDHILFAPASAALSAQGQALLEQLAAILNTLPYSVSVEGHSDNVPIHTDRYPSNWELSAARASSATRALIERGVAAERLRAIGYGDTRPRGDNDTPQARAQNRRVTFVLQVD